MTDVIYECPSDTSSIAGVNKTILRAGIQGILPIHKFRMKHYVTLLARRFQIRQALPCFRSFVRAIPATATAEDKSPAGAFVSLRSAQKCHKSIHLHVRSGAYRTYWYQECLSPAFLSDNPKTKSVYGTITFCYCKE